MGISFRHYLFAEDGLLRRLGRLLMQMVVTRTGEKLTVAFLPLIHPYDGDQSTLLLRTVMLATVAELRVTYMLLTPAQNTVAGLVAQGMANKEIAHALGLAEPTVCAHVMQALRRLGLRNRVQLAVWHAQSSAAPLQ